MVRMITRWSVALVLTLGAALAAGVDGTPDTVRAAAGASAPTINLAHLDFLHDTVPYTIATPEHSTTDPGTPIDTWWVYANYNSANGTYTRTGGGTYNAATNTYGQGAFDTDDVARAAVVYLTHYRYYGDQHSLQMARGALRFVLYMHAAGPHAVTLTYAGDGTTDAKIDAILLQPVAESKVLADGLGGTLAIYKSLAESTVNAQLPALAPLRTWMVQVYDRNGNGVAMYPLHPRPDGAGVVPVLAYGFTLAVGR